MTSRALFQVEVEKKFLFEEIGPIIKTIEENQFFHFNYIISSTDIILESE